MAVFTDENNIVLLVTFIPGVDPRELPKGTKNLYFPALECPNVGDFYKPKKLDNGDWSDK